MYQLGIIGGGPAGYVAAERAGQKGLKVVIFEAKDLGGVCLNEGCIPTKSFLYSAKLYDQARGGSKYGILNEGTGFDYDKILKRKNRIVKKMVGSVGAKMKHNHVDVVKGQAIIKGRKDGVIMVESGEDTYQLENLLICTGSESAIPPIPGLSLSSDYLLTNREALQLDSLPESLTVIGGGVIGLEFASFFNSMGVTVTVVEMLDEILMGMDKELSSELRKQFEKKGITFHLSSKVTKVDGGQVHFESNGEVHTINSAKILVSTGRRPVVDGFGLENLGVELFKGGIKVNEKMATNIPNVYAAGDVTGFSLLAHTASREGEVVVNNLTGRKDHMRYNAIPGVVYTNPEFSGVGLTEEAARAKNIDYDVVRLPMAYAGRFTIENEGGSGFIKLLLGKKYKEVLGVHMLGNPSSEMIYGAVMAIEMEMTQKQLQEIVFPHPTVSEIFKEALFV